MYSETVDDNIVLDWNRTYRFNPDSGSFSYILGTEQGSSRDYLKGADAVPIRMGQTAKHTLGSTLEIPGSLEPVVYVGPEVLDKHNPKGQLVVSVDPRDLAQGSRTTAFFEFNVNSSTTLSAINQKSLIIDVGGLLRNTIVAYAKWTHQNVYAAKALMVVSGLVPMNLPVYKITLSWDVSHANDNINENDTVEVSFVAHFRLSAQSLRWTARRPVLQHDDSEDSIAETTSTTCGMFCA